MRYFGHRKPERVNGEIVGSFAAPVRVKTRGVLASNYGLDAGKRLVVTAHAEDLIGLRPERTRRELFISAMDLYAEVVRLTAARELREKRRERANRREKRQ